MVKGFFSAGSAGSEADRRPVHAAQHRARKTRKRKCLIGDQINSGVSPCDCDEAGAVNVWT